MYFLNLIFHISLIETLQQFADRAQKYRKTAHIRVQIIVGQNLLDLFDVAKSCVAVEMFKVHWI